MRFPKYTCSNCGKPSSRWWNLRRHIRLCHQGAGECLQNWDFPQRHFPPHWSKRSVSDTSKDERNFYYERAGGRDIEQDYLKIQTEEFAKELGRLSAREHMNKIKRGAFSIPSPHYADQISAGIQPNTSEDSYEIFGFRGYACDNCFTVGTLHVRFGEGEEGRHEDVHSCDPARGVQNKGSAGETRNNAFLHSRVLHLVKEMVSFWTRNNPFLVAIRLENPVKENIALFKSGTMEKKMITFQFSREKRFDITLSSQNIDNHRHIMEAVRSGKTPLDDPALTNIIEMLKGVTFGTITVYYNATLARRRQHHSSDSYFVYITSYSALDKVKEGWQHDPIGDFMASIKADVLYPGPFY